MSNVIAHTFLVVFIIKNQFSTFVYVIGFIEVIGL